MSLLPDTHAHLDAPEFAEDIDEIIARASAAGVDRILAVGSDLASSRRAVALAKRFHCVYAAVGLHPHEATGFDAQKSGLQALLDADKVVAVGEIGLDYRRDVVPRIEQRVAFAAQLQWAEERGLPASVHNRDADADVLEAVSEHSVAVVWHCFSGSQDVYDRVLHSEDYVSFAGNLTFRNADSLREQARRVPLERVLVETDAPVLAPQRWRGERNEPAHVLAVIAELATIRESTPADLGATLAANADRVFRWRGA